LAQQCRHFKVSHSENEALYPFSTKPQMGCMLTPTLVMYSGESLTETEQINNSQTDETHKETIVGRISGRQKKTPITRNKDFLWEE